MFIRFHKAFVNITCFYTPNLIKADFSCGRFKKKINSKQKQFRKMVHQYEVFQCENQMCLLIEIIFSAMDATKLHCTVKRYYSSSLLLYIFWQLIEFACNGQTRWENQCERERKKKALTYTRFGRFLAVFGLTKSQMSTVYTWQLRWHWIGALFSAR